LKKKEGTKKKDFGEVAGKVEKPNTRATGKNNKVVLGCWLMICERGVTKGGARILKKGCLQP